MELCLRPGGWLSALARLFAAEDPAPQSRAQAQPEVNARAEKLLDAYGDLLLRYAYSYLHNMADAEEVLQDTLVQFLKNAPVFLNKAHEKAWLLRVAANLSKNRLSYNKLRQTDELNEELTAEGRLFFKMPSPTRGRWHGKAVTDEVEALAATRRCPPHQSASG